MNNLTTQTAPAQIGAVTIESDIFSNYPDLLTIGQLQEALSVGRSTAYRLINGNTIKHLRIGKAIKIPKQFLVDFIITRCYNGSEIIDGKQRKGVKN